jgi:hypothetical protein
LSLIKFPSVEQYRNVIKAVQHRTNYDGKDEDGKSKFTPRPQPTLKYRGTVKLHGTNAGIVRRFNGADPVFQYQSKERILTLEQDNAGFMLAMMGKESALVQLFSQIEARFEHGESKSVFDTITVFGEWAGGNIQKGVALNGLPKFFAYFAVRVGEGEDAKWFDIERFADIEFREEGLFNILTFGKWETDIDFERPLEVQNKLGELTLEVEKQCPAGKHFGQDGIGEGIVWTCVTPGWWSSDFWMKIKGEKHSVSKVKTLAAVDTEAVRAVADFVESVVTEGRLVQGAQNLVREQGKPFEMSSMGDFIKWVYGDVMKEETDTIVANQLDPKKLGGPIANKARQWFVARFNEGADFSA